MALTCPACRKVNEAETNPECERCGCDLRALDAIAKAAAWHLSAAADCLRAGERAEARAHSRRSLELRRTREAVLFCRYAWTAQNR
jgi:hypothetical protein